MANPVKRMFSRVGRAAVGLAAAGMLTGGLTPAEVPVLTARDMELSVNPAAAERMGVTIPATILNRADHTVE